MAVWSVTRRAHDYKTVAATLDAEDMEQRSILWTKVVNLRRGLVQFVAPKEGTTIATTVA